MIYPSKVEAKFPCYELGCDMDWVKNLKDPVVPVAYSDNPNELMLALYNQYAGMFKTSTDVEYWSICLVNKNNEPLDDESKIQFFEIYNNRREVASETVNKLYADIGTKQVYATEYVGDCFYNGAKAIAGSIGSVAGSLNSVSKSISDIHFPNTIKVHNSHLTNGGWE